MLLWSLVTCHSHDSLPSIRWDGNCLQLLISFRAAAQHHMSTQSPYYTCWFALSTRSLRMYLTADKEAWLKRLSLTCSLTLPVISILCNEMECVGCWRLRTTAHLLSSFHRQNSSNNNTGCKLSDAKCDREIGVQCCQCELSCRCNKENVLQYRTKAKLVCCLVFYNC